MIWKHRHASRTSYVFSVCCCASELIEQHSNSRGDPVSQGAVPSNQTIGQDTGVGGQSPAWLRKILWLRSSRSSRASLAARARLTMKLIWTLDKPCRRISICIMIERTAFRGIRNRGRQFPQCLVLQTMWCADQAHLWTGVFHAIRDHISTILSGLEGHQHGFKAWIILTCTTGLLL